jgi:hypothetical protein
MTKPRFFVPFSAAVLLLLPVLYVGSYLALVVPGHGGWRASKGGELSYEFWSYRVGGSYSERLFWPLEQIDRRLRPGVWRDRLEL